MIMEPHMTTGETYSEYIESKRLLRNIKTDVVFTIEPFVGVDDNTYVGTMLVNTTNFITGVVISNAGLTGGAWSIQVPTVDNGSAGIFEGWLGAGQSIVIQNGGILGVYKSPILLNHAFGSGKAYGCIIRFRENVQV